VLDLLNVPNVDKVNVVNVDDVNRALSLGNLDHPGLFPRLEALRAAAAVFRMEFGLDQLPVEPGVLIIRGARQSGKSTWLERSMRETIETHGPGSALFLDGDHIRDIDHLAEEVVRLSSAFGKDAEVRRLFIDEITAVPDWARGLKRVLDRGELRRVLVVTTGSHAADLRHGKERLPGRKGKHARTGFLFLPVSYDAFLSAGGVTLGERALAAYLVSGGSPLACGELIRAGRIPEWVIETIQDWVLGECARTGRARRSLVSMMEQLHRHGSSPLGQTKLAKEAGLANNTVAAGWIELLADLLCIGLSPAWDASRRMEMPRKPAKFPFINLLAAAVWAPEAPRSAEELARMSPERQEVWYEWTAAQELFRRRALRGEDEPERIPHWRGAGHEIDFVEPDGSYLEIKLGRATALDFAWFPKIFPRAHLDVVCATPFESDHVRGLTLHQFLMGQ
jgi:uncharacterized protein